MVKNGLMMGNSWGPVSKMWITCGLCCAKNRHYSPTYPQDFSFIAFNLRTQDERILQVIFGLNEIKKCRHAQEFAHCAGGSAFVEATRGYCDAAGGAGHFLISLWHGGIPPVSCAEKAMELPKILEFIC